MGRGDSGGDLVNAPFSLRAPPFVHRAQRPGDLYDRRNDVGRSVGDDPPDRQHGRDRGVVVAADHLLQRRDQRGGGYDRIGHRVRQGAVAAGAVYFYPQFVARSHVLSAAETEVSHCHFRGDVLPDECDHPVIAERVFCHDHRRASGANLFAGLEQPEHGSGDLRFVPVQHEQRAEQAGGVHVVPAGVHHSVVPGGAFESGFLPDRQRVRVGPEHHAALQVAVPFDARQDTRSGDPAEQDSRFGKLCGDVIRRFVLFERQLRPGVDRPADGQYLFGNGLRVFFNRFVVHRFSVFRITRGRS